MALISMGDWIDRHGDSDPPLPDDREATPTTGRLPVPRRRALEALHQRLRSHARRSALRRALARRLAASISLL